MRRANRLLVAAVACVALGATGAAASLIPFSSASIGSGDAPVAACDPDGVSVAYTSSFDTAAADYRTTTVTVSGIAAACTGGRLALTVRNAAGAALAGATVSVTGSSVAVATAPFASSAVAGWAVALST